MTEDQKKNLETQLWGIANLLRGKISADDYRDYILGFIFFKYLSEKQKKIAKFISAIDQKISAMDKQIADSELFKKGLLKKMFV
jgi:type I restriction enzyme M protein